MNVINDSGGPKSVTIVGIPAGDYDLHQLDPTLCLTFGPKNRCTPQSSVVTASPSILLTMPTDAVWTLVQR